MDERETVRLSERVWDNLQRVGSVSPLGGPGEQVTSRGSVCCRDTQREKHKTIKSVRPINLLTSN